MQMDSVVASVLPFLADGDRDRRDDDRRRPRVGGRRRPIDDDARPDLEGKPWQTLAEMYTKLTLEENIAMIGDRPMSDSLGRLSSSKEKRNVEVRVSYLKVFKIDTRKQKFDADIFIQAKWEEPRLDGRSQKDSKPVSLEDFVIDGYWNPEIHVHNLSGKPDRQETWCDVIPAQPHPIVVFKTRLKGCFNERLELEDFPFDVQELQLIVASRLTEDEVELIPDQSRLSTINRHNTVDQSEWIYYDHVQAEEGIVRNKLVTAKEHHPCVAFHCSARRNPTFYFVNIFFMMFLLSSLIFCTLGIPAVDYEERLKINNVLLLSVVAMKFVSTNFYPVDLAYLTYMDIYSLLCVFMVTIMAIQNAVLSIFANNASLLTQVDQGTTYLIVALFLLVQVVSVIVATVVVCKAKYGVRKKDREYKDKQKELNRRMVAPKSNGMSRKDDLPMKSLKTEAPTSSRGESPRRARPAEDEYDRTDSPRRQRRRRVPEDEDEYDRADSPRRQRRRRVPEDEDEYEYDYEPPRRSSPSPRRGRPDPESERSRRSREREGRYT